MNLFQKVRIIKPRLNKFDLSHEKKMSMQMGDLIPILCQEVVPGDKFRVNSEVLMRFAPMLAPVMHRMNVTTHYFFVPNRLIWDEWEDFITGGRLGTSAPVAPYIVPLTANKTSYYKGTLADYLGLPLNNDSNMDNVINHSALPFRAYQLVWDEYYRDQNLAASLDISKASGSVTGTELAKLYVLRKRAWEKDYFTSCLPWAQRGGAVGTPITGDVGPGTLRTGDVRKDSDDTLATGDLTANIGVMKAGADDAYADIIGAGDLDNASVDINELRRSVRLQEWLEKNARAGGRYIEQLLAHFGVISSDARLQRPEYLGGAKNPVVISEVLSTFQTEAEGLPQGNMAGHGISVGANNGFSKRFEEHGFIIGMMSVLPRTAYQQGMARMWSRFDKFDYFWPEFANIGEQEVKNKEIYVNWNATSDEPEGTFGYQSRYAEYKYAPSTVHGDMRDNLSFWQMARIFDDVPVLNEAFVTSDPTQRIFAVTDETVHKLYCQIYQKVDALRPMPYFGTPSL